MLKEYFNKKGLSSADIFDVNGIILKNGVFYGNSDYWTRLCKGVLEYKKKTYADKGINEAVFIPVYNVYSEFTGFVVRKMHNTNKQDSFFLEGFEKKNLIFNLNNAMYPIMSENKVYIVEGPFDCLKLKVSGLSNVVSLLGTSFTKGHIIQLRQFTDNIVLCLDGDAAGQETVNKIYTKYKSIFNFSIINVPLDPDEYVNLNGLQSYLDKEMNYEKYVDGLLKTRIV